ncbi:MAG: thiamine diphosphokinase [Caldisericaceae bacterium]
MKSCLLVANGTRNPPQFLRELSKKVNFVIGIDAGAEYLLESGVKVNLAIGDFDSIKNKNLLKNIDYLEYPKEKDYSDTEIAINHAVEKGFNELIFTNMLGGRTDHILFNLSLLYKVFGLGKTAKILENKEEIYIFDKHIEIETEINDIISVFPMLPPLKFTESKGLYYKLKDKTVTLGETLTLSNFANENRVSISLSSGVAILIVRKVKPKF